MERTFGPGGFLNRALGVAAGVTLTITRANSDGGYSGTLTDAVVGAQETTTDDQGRLKVDYTSGPTSSPPTATS
jgi:hypothetical protein